MAERSMASPWRALITGLWAAAVAVGVCAAAGPLRPAAQDPLDVAVQPNAFSRSGATTGIARSGDRLIAVGPRGLILLSVDGAKTWNQVPSPVGADLVTVKFTGAGTAWAVGHDAVALRSLDGGATWERVLDGRSVLKLLRETYAERARRGEAGADAAVGREIERSAQQSATPGVLPAPFLDVWFADANEGFLVGAFGLLLRTTDGGKTWEPWIARADNERRFHLYAVTGHDDRRYIAGEQGLVLRWDASASRFVKIETPYNGTYFGIDASRDRIVVYGLRGNAYMSMDGGSQWRKIDTGVDANLVALVPLAEGRMLLVSQVGHVLAVAPGSQKATPLQVPYTTEVFAAVHAGPRGLAFAQINGIRVVELADQPTQ